LCTIVVHSTA